MGMFGFVHQQPTRPYTPMDESVPAPGPKSPIGVFDPSQMSKSDRLMMLGAMLRDTGGALRGDDSQSVLQMQQLLASRQIMAARQRMIDTITGQNAPGVGVAPIVGQPKATFSMGGGMGPDGLNLPQVSSTSGGVDLNAPVKQAAPMALDDPRMAGMALQAKAVGLDLGDYLKLQELNKPEYHEGVRVSPYDRNAPAYIPKQIEGQQPDFSPGGQLTGVHVIPGAEQAAWRMAGAQTDAQEAAKAHYATSAIPVSNGGTVTAPNDVAIPYLRDAFLRRYGQPGGGPLVPQAGGGGQATGYRGGGAGGELGVSQTPAEATLANARANTQGEREKLLPKETGALQDLDNRSSLTSNIMHQMLGDVQDPKTGQWRAGANPEVRFGTVGAIGKLMSHVPETDAYDIDQQLEHVRAMTSLDELEKLRENSPTGAGLGRVTQQEINLLAAMRGSIDQGQKRPQFIQNMRRQLQQLDQIRANRHQVYSSTYGNVQQPAPLGQGPAPAAATARRGGGGYTIIGVRRGGQ